MIMLSGDGVRAVRQPRSSFEECSCRWTFFGIRCSDMAGLTMGATPTSLSTVYPSSTPLIGGKCMVSGTKISRLRIKDKCTAILRKITLQMQKKMPTRKVSHLFGLSYRNTPCPSLSELLLLLSPFRRSSRSFVDLNSNRALQITTTLGLHTERHYKHQVSTRTNAAKRLGLQP